jgi:cytochrome c5
VTAAGEEEPTAPVSVETGKRRGRGRRGPRLRRAALGGVALVAAVGGGFAWRGTPAPAPGPGDTAGGGTAAATTTWPADVVAEGAWLFQVKGCATCHTTQARTFPDLSDASEWAGERVAGMSAEEYLAESILDPSAAVSPQLAPGTGLAMPRLNVTDEEVDALVAYLLGN